jgi:hypothetical protein
MRGRSYRRRMSERDPARMRNLQSEEVRGRAKRPMFSRCGFYYFRGSNANIGCASSANHEPIPPKFRPSKRKNVTIVTDRQIAAGENRQRMRISSHIRKSASLLLAAFILFWTSLSSAMEPGSKMVHLCHTPVHHTVANPAPAQHHENCCPSHANLMHKCQLQVALTLVATHPECCTISAPPARPFAVLVNSAGQVPLHASAAVVSGLDIDVARSTRGAESSPYFVKPVFDLKTDLRI